MTQRWPLVISHSPCALQPRFPEACILLGHDFKCTHRLVPARTKRWSWAQVRHPKADSPFPKY